jgi:ribosome maturation factor RimP
LQALGFVLDVLREARLAPIVDFKGRRARPADGSPDPASGAPAPDAGGMQESD